MPTIDKLVNGAKQLKVKEVPQYVSNFAGEHWTLQKTQTRLSNWLQSYKTKVRMSLCMSISIRLYFPVVSCLFCSREQEIDGIVYGIYVNLW